MELVFELLDEPELRDGPVGWRRAPGVPARVARAARAGARLGARRPSASQPLVVRLVKGAYWDHEVVEARQHGWTPPVFEQKRDSDRNFEELTRRLIEALAARAARDRLAQPALGGARHRRQRGSWAARTATWSSRCCAASATTWRPRWPTRPPRAHLLPGGRPRRGHGLPRAAAAREHRERVVPGRAAARHARSRSCWRRRELPERAGPGAAAGAGARDARWRRCASSTRSCRCDVPVSIGGGRGRTAGLRLDRSGQPDRVVAQRAGRDARRTLLPRSRRPGAASATGARAPPPSAPRCCARPRQILRERRLELAALQVRECAKPWPEADADVCEAIDFLEYYAREAVELERGPRAPPGAGRAQHDALRARAAWPP